jgi:hypothetical protein
MSTLNDLMEFYHVVTSDGEGNVTDGPSSLYAPQPYVDLNSEGQMISLSPADIHDLGEWTLLDGFSGQHGYSGPIMHESEFVGGGLERHIRENAGYYAVVEITGIGGDDDDNCVGWAVAFRSEAS